MNSTAEAAKREEMQSMFRNLAEETICDVFATGYCASTKGPKNVLLLVHGESTLRNDPPKSARQDAQPML